MRIEGFEEDVRAAPTRVGTVRMIVRRPAVDDAGDVAIQRVRGSSRTADGSAHPEAQVTVMSARAAAGIAGDVERWPLAGDQLYVDFDISEENLTAGTRLRVGEAEIEVSAKPHTGCAKFSARFGKDALRLVSSPEGRALRLRGMNASVTKSGTVRVGDRIEVSVLA